MADLRAVLSITEMPHKTLNFLIAILKEKEKKRGGFIEINFNNIFYVTHSIKSIIISTCNQHKRLLIVIFYVLPVLLSFQNQMSILYLTAHLSLDGLHSCY